MEIPRIRITEIDDICVLICHLIYSLGCPLTKDELIEITSFEDAVNYFNLTTALEKASGHLLDVTDIDGEMVYSNTPMGIKAAKDLGAELPLSVRDKMFKEAVRVYTRDAMKKNRSFLAVRYIQNLDGTCTIGVRIMNEESAKQQYYLEIAAENSERADFIKSKIMENTKKFKSYIDDYFK